MSSLSGLHSSSMVRWHRIPAVASRLMRATNASSYRPITWMSAAHHGKDMHSMSASPPLAHVHFQPTTRIFTQTRQFADAADGSIKVKLPALSPTMELGTIVSWQAKEGAKVNEGDLLCEIETDKATMGFETPEEGYLAKIIITEGTKDVPIGKLLCILVQNESDVAKYANYQPTAEDEAGLSAGSAAAPPPPPPKPTSAPAPTSSGSKIPPSTDLRPTDSFGKMGVPAGMSAPSPSAFTPAPSQPQTAAPGARVKASPFAKKLAQEKGVNLQGVAGTGPGGRIIAVDVTSAPVGGAPAAAQQAYVPSVPPPLPTSQAAGGFEDIAVSGVRKAMADRLTWSKQNVPHYYLTTECDLTNSLSAVDKLNKLLVQRSKNAEAPKLTINDFVVKAAALACLRVPEANSYWMDTHVRHHHFVDITLLVDSEHGVQTPVIRNAHAKGLSVINREAAVLTARAEAGQLQQQEIEGGTFAIQNLSESDVTKFASIIVPPQSCVLAVGSPVDRMVADKEHVALPAQFMSVTLSCDHRVVDGAVGAQWLQHFRAFLEKPQTMLL